VGCETSAHFGDAAVYLSKCVMKRVMNAGLGFLLRFNLLQGSFASRNDTDDKIDPRKVRGTGTC